jgi:hypothetical protein
MKLGAAIRLGEAGRQYQNALEAARAHQDEPECREELDQARSALAHAWLEASYAEPPA